MNNFIIGLVSEYGLTIIGTILTGIIGYIGVAIKAVIKKKYEEEVKERVAERVVCMVEQVYAEAPGEEKLQQATITMLEMLGQKEIFATELEIKVLIEAAVLKHTKNKAEK